MQTLETVTPTSSLKSFFDAFGFNLITLSIQPERPGAVMPAGRWFDPVNRVRAVTPDVFHSDEFQKELQLCQSRGMAIYFMINEGDGLPEAGSGTLNCGKTKNITHFRTLYIDTDNADYDALYQKLREIQLAPHYIVESSPDKYHFYFILKPVLSENNNRIQWQSLQHLLDDLVPDLDQNMTNINRVSRVPGFFNQKPALKESFQVRIHRICERLDPYDLQELYTRLEAERYNDFQGDVLGVNGSNGHYNKFEFPVGKVPEGQRRKKITGYLEHLMGNKVSLYAPEEEYLRPMDGFILQYLDRKDWGLFLEGGKRRPNLLTYLHDQLKRRIKIEQETERYRSDQQMTHNVAVTDEKLNDDFYQNFPDDLGMITKEISNYSPYLPKELCFAGALAISGALKAETFRYKGAWPMVNGLIIAGTGVGKSMLKDIVERTLEFAGLRGKYPQLIGFQNSVQSLHTALYAAGGVGTVIIDESGDYLQTITSKNAPGYAKLLKKYFKEATTCRDEGTRLHPGGSLSYQVPAIAGGLLSIWMLIQPDKFESSMSLEDMADGFLPRFFIFNGKSKIKLTENSGEDADHKSFTPSTDFQVYLQSLVQMMSGLSVKEITDTAEKELKESTPKVKADVIHTAKRDAVYNARAEARKIGNNKVTVSITEEANFLVQAYLKEQEEEANKIQSKNSDDPALGVFIRIKEMLFRLMCNAATWDFKSKQATINASLAGACIQFHKFQTTRFLSNEVAEISKGSGERDLEVVMKGFKKAYFDKKNQPVKAGEILSVIRSTKRPRNITLVLQELVKRGQLIIELLPNKKLSTHKIAHYTLGEEN